MIQVISVLRTCLLILVLFTAAVPAAPPVIGSFTASKTAIVRGESVTLNWSVTGANTVTLRPPLIPVSGNSYTFAATGTQVYTLTASNRNGDSTAKVKLYDLNQKAFFTDTVLITGGGSVEEVTWEGLRLKSIALDGALLNVQTLYFWHDSAIAPDGALLGTASMTFNSGGGLQSGLLRYEPESGSWAWHSQAGAGFGLASAGDISVIGNSAVYSQRSIRIGDFAQEFVLNQSPEMAAGGDGRIHNTAAPVSYPEPLDYFSPQTGVLLGRYSFAGVSFPPEDVASGNMRVDAVDVTPDGERIIGTLGGRMFRLMGQPAVLQGSMDFNIPGTGFRSAVYDLHVAPDGKLIAGSREGWVLFTDRQFNQRRYQRLGTGSSAAYTAFTSTGLTRPRVEYFRPLHTGVSPGGSTELTWNVAGAASVNITGVGSGLPPEGSAPVTVPSTTVFELTAENSWGHSTAEAAVVAGEPPVINSFTSDPVLPPLGQQATLTWNILGADRAWISPGLGDQAPDSGSLNYLVTGGTTLWLTAENEHGRRRASLTIQAGSPENGSQYLNLIPFQSTWQWLHPVNGVDPAVNDTDFHTTWMKPDSYNGPAFQGPSPAMFGYGLIDCCIITTDITMPPSGLRYTAYFRKGFTVPEVSMAVTADALVDDGFVIYIDGQEKGRRNYAGPDTFRGLTPSFANETSGGLTELGILPSGQHWLGVSVHNYTSDSSDLGLILRLFGTIPWYGLAPDSSGRKQITFSEAAVGATAYTAGSNGSNDAGWSQQPGNWGRVADFAAGHALRLSVGTTRLTGDFVDLRNLIAESARVDVKAWQTAGGNGYETGDTIEAWVEATADGMAFSRIATLVPLRRGGAELIPPNDQILPLDSGEAGAFTRFTTAPGAIGPQWRGARIVINAVNDHSTEFFAFDNLVIEGTPPSVDSDADGLSDVWEHTWFGGLSAATGSSDADRDGHSNASEQIAGTDPLNAASRLDYTAVTFPSAEAPGQLTWMSVAGKTYNLQSSGDMIVWENLDTGIPSDGKTTTTAIPPLPHAGRNCYRVLVNR